MRRPPFCLRCRTNRNGARPSSGPIGRQLAADQNFISGVSQAVDHQYASNSVEVGRAFTAHTETVSQDLQLAFTSLSSSINVINSQLIDSTCLFCQFIHF